MNSVGTNWTGSLPIRLAGFAVLWWAATALGQSPAAPDTDSTVVYEAAYFSSFNPNTVNDMLDRIPGINQALNAQGGGPGGPGGDRGARGLGSSAQILIDGKRMAGKANEARAQLDRISASQVQRIEIIRGTSSALDVQNSGQLVNIVLREALSRFSVTSELSSTHHEDGTVKPNGNVALSGQQGSLDYLVSLDVRSGYQRLDSLEGAINGDFSPKEHIRITRWQDQTNYSLNSNLAWSLSEADRIALNVLYVQSDPPARLNRTILTHGRGAPVLSYEREDIPATADNWEVGGDFEHQFRNGSRFKILAIINERNNDVTRERFASTSADGPWRKNLFLDTTSRYRERILRSSHTWNPAAGHGLEAGLEIAQTIQDSGLLLGLRTSGPGSPDYGGLTPIPQPNSHSTVEELRYEPFVVHNWQINPRMTLESSMVMEFSEIEQTGDVNKKRDFDFLKPKLDYRFNLSNTLQLRGTLEKRVSQLSFADFSRSTNPRDDDQDTVAGNPELEPEEFYRAEAGMDYRLPNDAGTFNARYFYEYYENKIGKIDISPSPTNLISTNGNIGSAEAYGLVLNGSLRLGFLGLPRMLVTGGLTVQEGEYNRDPLIPVEHGFIPYDRGGYNIGLRHDMPAWRLNYGFNFNARIEDGRLTYDIDSRSTYPIPYRMSAWVEKTGWLNLTYRLDASNMFEQEACILRHRYQGYFRDGVLKEIENICSTTGLLVSFRVRGTF